MEYFKPVNVRLLKDMPGAKRSKRLRAGSIVQFQHVPRGKGLPGQAMLGFLDANGNGTLITYDPVEGVDFEEETAR